jgi:hypothetical protein
MKKKILVGGLLAAAFTSGIIFAADHIDAPAVTGANSTSTGADITDIYAFQSPTDNSKMVFVMNVQGLMSPAATSAASFPNNVMYEFNIDNNGDNVEDLVIQALVQNGKIRVYGPVAPAVSGTMSTVKTNGVMTETSVTAYNANNPSIGTNSNGIKIFAGPRDDPFFLTWHGLKKSLAGHKQVFAIPE